MKVLVTGGSGFIGTWLASESVGDGHVVSILDLRPSSVHIGVFPIQFTAFRNGVRTRRPPAARPEQTLLWSRLGFGGHFVVQYSRNMGLRQDIRTLVRAAHRLAATILDLSNTSEEVRQMGK